MRSLWRLCLCVGFVTLLVRSEEDDEDLFAPSEGDDADDQATPRATDSEDGTQPGGDLQAEQVMPLHGKMDADSDGKLSMSELLEFWKSTRVEIAKKDVPEQLESMDTNRDGKVSLIELAGMEGPELDEKGEPKKGWKPIPTDLERLKFKTADKNKDGFLDLEELPACLYPETNDEALSKTVSYTFQTQDEDGDGELNPQEYFQQEEGQKGEAYMSWDEQMLDFKVVDTDGSGKLSQEEVREWESGRLTTQKTWKEFFTSHDKDEDGHISPDELQKALPSMYGSEAGAQMSDWVVHHEL